MSEWTNIVTGDGLINIIGITFAVLWTCLMLLILLRLARHWNRAESTYSPRGDRVIVKRHERPEPTPGEMFTPQSQEKPLNSGTVVAIGPKVEGDLAIGDQVDFVDFAGAEIEFNGERCLIMRDEEIYGRRRGQCAA